MVHNSKLQVLKKELASVIIFDDYFRMSDLKAEGLWESMFNFRVGGVLTYLRNTYLGPVAVWTKKVDIVLTDPDDYETQLQKLSEQDAWPIDKKGECMAIFKVSSAALTTLFQALTLFCGENPAIKLSLNVLDPFFLTFFDLAGEKDGYQAINNPNDHFLSKALCALLKYNLDDVTLDGLMLHERCAINIADLFEALGTSSIRDLSLNRVFKGEEGCDVSFFMEDMLSVNKTITRLNISGNFLTAECIRAIVDVFHPEHCNRNTTVKQITFFEHPEDNDEDNEESAQILDLAGIAHDLRI